MSDDKLKKLSVEVSKTCLTNLKILSLQKDIKLTQLVRDILEKHNFAMSSASHLGFLSGMAHIPDLGLLVFTKDAVPAAGTAEH